MPAAHAEFGNTGKGVGLEIWRIEKLKPVAVAPRCGAPLGFGRGGTCVTRLD
tara:strand:+ start:309 stop:464 length:156 start_codon:yes stop_codon:yes gene_type:complete